MTQDILFNISILISFLLVMGQILKSNTFDGRQTLKLQCFLGVLMGFLGMILMLFNIKLNDIVVIDLRNIAIICAAILGGPISSIIAAVIIAFYRIIAFGVNTASITGHIVALAIGAITAWIANTKLSRKSKFSLMFFFATILSSFALIYLIRDTDQLKNTLYFYWLTNTCGGLLAFFTTEYIISANSSFKTMLYYRMTSDNLSDMISTCEPNGKYKFISPSVQQLFGYTQSEMIGDNALEYIHPEDLPSLQAFFNNHDERKDTFSISYRFKCKNGSYVWVESSVKAMKGINGSIVEFIAVTRDVSKRKQIEQDLEMSNARFKAIFENAGIGIVVRDINENIIEANPAYLDMTGYEKHEVNHLSKVVHPEDYRAAAEVFQMLSSGKCTSHRSEIRYLSKQNDIIYTDVTSTLIPGSEHTPVSVLRVINNITEYKKIQEKLVESEERFRAAFDSAAFGMCLADINGRFLRPNKMFCDLLGYSEAELVNMNFIQITHPEDLEADASQMKKLLSGEVSQFVFEKRYIHKSGRTIWTQLGVSAVYNKEHNPLYLVGEIQDITDRKLAEEELKKAKQDAEKLASIDFLTGVMNRRSFKAGFNEEFKLSEQTGSPISIILTDIDFFKKVNDTYGHLVGDIVLQNFSKCLSETARPSDFIGRHGGEEFIICLPNTDSEQAMNIAEQMRRNVESMITNLPDCEDTIKITASFGISSVVPKEEDSIQALILQADKAMYSSKEHGRNRVSIWTPSE